MKLWDAMWRWVRIAEGGSYELNFETAKLLIRLGANVNARDDQGVSILHTAAGAGFVKLCRLLLEGGAKVGAVDVDGFTPLHVAAQQGRDEVCGCLLAAGAKIDCEDCNGQTAEVLAEASSCYTLVADSFCCSWADSPVGGRGSTETTQTSGERCGGEEEEEADRKLALRRVLKCRGMIKKTESRTVTVPLQRGSWRTCVRRNVTATAVGNDVNSKKS
eukprot:768495-Hanusia_phi.AAC.1